MAGGGGTGGMAGGGGTGGMAGGGGMGGMAGGGGMGGMAGGGGMGGMGPVASSCLDLLNDGVDVDGTYLIVVGGSPLTVYCDMTSDGGGWTQLYDQDVALGYLPRVAWAAGVSTTPPNMGQYSILNLIDEFEGALPGFEFFIDWPADGSDFVQWEQTENPFVDRGTVSSIVQSPTNQTGCTDFGGLGLSAPGHGFSTLDGSTNGCAWWAVGAAVAYLGVGLPAYYTSDSGQGELVATRTRLWVR
jgi:hypothetical protein